MSPWVPLSIASLLSIVSCVMWLHVPLTLENVFLENVDQKGALKLGVLDVWSKPFTPFHGEAGSWGFPPYYIALC